MDTIVTGTNLLTARLEVEPALDLFNHDKNNAIGTPADMPIVYLNRGQFYSLKLKSNLSHATTTTSHVTTLKLEFHLPEHRAIAMELWSKWLSQAGGLSSIHNNGNNRTSINNNNSNNSNRETLEMASSCCAFEVDLQQSVGISHVITSVENDTLLNMIQFSWKSSATLVIRYFCLSTDFTTLKGVKGIPLRFVVDDVACGILHRLACRAKIFRDKGADRKHREDQRRYQKVLSDQAEDRGGGLDVKAGPSFACSPSSSYSTSTQLNTLWNMPLEDSSIMFDGVVTWQVLQLYQEASNAREPVCPPSSSLPPASLNSSTMLSTPIPGPHHTFLDQISTSCPVMPTALASWIPDMAGLWQSSASTLDSNLSPPVDPMDPCLTFDALEERCSTSMPHTVHHHATEKFQIVQLDLSQLPRQDFVLLRHRDATLEGLDSTIRDRIREHGFEVIGFWMNTLLSKSFYVGVFARDVPELLGQVSHLLGNSLTVCAAFLLSPDQTHLAWIRDGIDFYREPLEVDILGVAPLKQMEGMDLMDGGMADCSHFYAGSKQLAALVLRMPVVRTP